MSDNQKTLLVLNGVSHYLALLLQTAKVGPLITVENQEINALEGESVNPEHVVTLLHGEYDLDNHEEIVFYKQHGKFTILAGKAKYDARPSTAANYHVRGRLLSTPALKKCRVPVPDTAPVNNDPAIAFVPNRPRMVDRRSSPRRDDFNRDAYAPRKPGGYQR